MFAAVASIAVILQHSVNSYFLTMLNLVNNLVTDRQHDLLLLLRACTLLLSYWIPKCMLGTEDTGYDFDVSKSIMKPRLLQRFW